MTPTETLDLGLWTISETNRITVAYESFSDNHYYAYARVSWYSEYTLRSYTLSPNLSLEARQVIGNDTLRHKMTVGSASALVRDQTDEQQYRFAASIQLRRGNFDLNLGASTYEASGTETHNFWLSGSYQF